MYLQFSPKSVPEGIMCVHSVVIHMVSAYQVTPKLIRPKTVPTRLFFDEPDRCRVIRTD